MPTPVGAERNGDMRGITVGRSPAPQVSPHGDGRFLIDMLLGINRGGVNEPNVEPVLNNDVAIAPPRQIVQDDRYIDDAPVSVTELPNIAAQALNSRQATPFNQQRIQVPDDPRIPPSPARPQAQTAVASNNVPPRPDVGAQVTTMMDDMTRMLTERQAARGGSNPLTNTAEAGSVTNTPMDAIDTQRPGAALDQAEQRMETFPDGNDALLAAILAAAAALGSRGRGGNVPPSGGMPSSGTAVDTRGMEGDILGPQQLPPPSRPSTPNPHAAIETDILSATPNELPVPARNDVTQSNARSTQDTVQNANTTNTRRGDRRVRYGGQEYTVTETGQVLDRNGDVVRASGTINGVMRAMERSWQQR